MKAIVQDEHPVLRESAQIVPPEKITSQKIQQTIVDMQEALASQPDGVAIAAPQIGEPVQIFVVAGKVFGENMPDRVFINPKLKKLSKKTEIMHEGCLSVRGYYGHVERHIKALVKAYDKTGKRFKMRGRDLLAQIFQHEVDHLHGVLFIDKATHIEKTNHVEQES